MISRVPDFVGRTGDPANSQNTPMEHRKKDLNHQVLFLLCRRSTGVLWFYLPVRSRRSNADHNKRVSIPTGVQKCEKKQCKCEVKQYLFPRKCAKLLSKQRAPDGHSAQIHPKHHHGKEIYL